MLRTLLFGMLFFLFATTTFGQDQPLPVVPEPTYQTSQSLNYRLMRHLDFKKLEPQPVQGNPALNDVRLYILGEEAGADIGFPGDVLSRAS